MKKILLLLLISVSLSGCSLIPKKVELFQDKVHKFPETTQKQKELQREAAQIAKEKAQETLVAATAEAASPAVIAPAKETALLTDVVAESIGAPAKRSYETPKAVADDLRSAMAKHDKKVDSFTKDNNENTGKKIEGTGLLQVPYFLWAGGIVLLLFILWHLARTALMAASAANPGALIGVGAMNLTGTLASKGISQLVAGGQKFTDWVEKKIDDPALKGKILEAFSTAHKKSQDQDVRTVVDHLLK